MADATTEPKADATAPTTEPTSTETETSTAAAEKSASDAPAAVCPYLSAELIP